MIISKELRIKVETERYCGKCYHETFSPLSLSFLETLIVEWNMCTSTFFNMCWIHDLKCEQLSKRNFFEAFGVKKKIFYLKCVLRTTFVNGYHLHPFSISNFNVTSSFSLCFVCVVLSIAALFSTTTKLFLNIIYSRG